MHIKAAGEYGNNAALTPPMGWSSWNTFRNNINEQLILDTADAMKKSGLLDAGYQYVNLDDCWHSSVRDKDGRLQGDLKLFSSGIKSLVQQLNEKGFKLVFIRRTVLLRVRICRRLSEMKELTPRRLLIGE